jgi:hypothetical protein
MPASGEMVLWSMRYGVEVEVFYGRVVRGDTLLLFECTDDYAYAEA